MASLVHIKRTNRLGSEVYDAIEQIRNGLALLHKREGVRAQTIAVADAKFGSVFGIEDDDEALALSQRMAAINAGNFGGLSDFLDATILVDASVP